MLYNGDIGAMNRYVLSIHEMFCTTNIIGIFNVCANFEANRLINDDENRIPG